MPDVEIDQDDKFEEMWETMGAEMIKSSFLTMLHVTPEYVVLVSNPADIIVDEDESETILPLRGYIAAKSINRESWQRFRQRKSFEWAKITVCIRFWPQFMEDQKSVLDEHEHLHISACSQSREVESFQCARTRVGIHRITDRAAKENI